MCEVNIHNFKNLYPTIEKALRESKFVGIDLEFSALNPVREFSPSLFDTPAERYHKLKENVENIIPLQVGLTAFTYDSNRNSYCGKIYTFYVQPACFQFVHRRFYFQSSTLNFLKSYNFDFNKFAYSGIPFINKDQEFDLRRKLERNEVSDTHTNCRAHLEEILDREGEIIKKWYGTATTGDFLAVSKVCNQRYNNEETIYFLQKILRDRFKNIWTSVKGGEFIVKKVTKEEKVRLEKEENLEEDLLDNLVGFSKVIRLLISLQKPIVGHNCIQDLLLLIHNFEQTLPPSYNDFKKVIVELFPTIFDTKSISYALRRALPEETRWSDKGLDHIFDYFKNNRGRHIAPNSPAIEFENGENTYGKMHDAGWDSFCAGYIFIRMSHLYIQNKYPKSKTFVPSEYIGGLMEFKNRINLIRCSLSYINLDGPDPASTRPPYLVVESRRNKPVNIPQVISLLSSFGFIEIRKIPFSKTRALIAVDNYSSANRILRDLKSDKEFRVRQYSVLRHSPVTKILLMSVVASGAMIIWLAKSISKT